MLLMIGLTIGLDLKGDLPETGLDDGMTLDSSTSLHQRNANCDGPLQQHFKKCGQLCNQSFVNPDQANKNCHDSCDAGFRSPSAAKGSKEKNYLLSSKTTDSNRKKGGKNDCEKRIENSKKECIDSCKIKFESPVDKQVCKDACLGVE